MSESLSTSPLDTIRTINQQAGELDLLILEQEGSPGDDSSAYLELMSELDSKNPLIGKDVVVYGYPLTIGWVMMDLLLHLYTQVKGIGMMISVQLMVYIMGLLLNQSSSLIRANGSIGSCICSKLDG